MNRRGKEDTASIILAVTLHLLLVSSCAWSEPRSWPFPEVRSTDETAVITTFRERTWSVRSLYAELTMVFERGRLQGTPKGGMVEGGELSGVFETVVYFHAPDRMRVTAFKDLLVTTRRIFDLTLSKDSYVLQVDEEGETRRYRGAASNLAARHESLGVFAALRERLFLPGLVLPRETARVLRHANRLEVTVNTDLGDRIIWLVDPRTLGIRKASVWSPDRQFAVDLEYLSYRKIDDVYLPERFRLVDAATGASLSGWLRHVEVNPELDPAIFDEPFSG